MAKSYKQARIKYAYFSECGYNCQFVEGRRKKIIDTFGIEPEYDAPDNPFHKGEINVENTKNKLGVENLPEMDKLDLSCNIIFSVINNLNVISSQLPDNWVIFVDDVGRDDVSILKKFDKSIPQGNSSVVVYKYKKAKGKYYVAPKEYRLGYDVKQKIIFTTSEEITSILLKKHYKCNVKEVKTEVEGSNITLVKTKLTRANYDGILFVLATYMKRSHDLEYIADGIKGEFNHTTIKGLNDFVDKNLIIEISQPSPDEVYKLHAELENELDPKTITCLLTLDQFHQAVGRASGHRIGKGENEIVVLVDEAIGKFVEKNSAYKIGISGNVSEVIRWSETGSIANVLTRYMRGYVSNLLIGTKGGGYILKSVAKEMIDNKMSNHVCERVNEAVTSIMNDMMESDEWKLCHGTMSMTGKEMDIQMKKLSDVSLMLINKITHSYK